MRVIEISSAGGPDVLRLGDRPKPAPGVGEVLIRVRASGINRPDVLQRAGKYPAPAGASDIPGLEVAGTIESGDLQAMAQAGLSVGERVCALVAGGGYAEYCVAPIGQCLPVPQGLSDVEAASLPETFFTVWSNVFDRGALKSGETLLVQGGTSGINRPDVLQCAGKYPAPAGASDIPGLEVAGTIESGDLQAMAQAGLSVGERVCALVAGGGYAEYCVAPIGQCLPVPQGLSDVEAASLPETFFTVWSNVFDRGALKSGETLLVQGGTSGIGVTAIQIAKAMGARVIATAGSDEKCTACLGLGADHAINYKTQDFQVEALRMTEGRGVDVVLDMVAGAYVAKEVQCLADDGRLVIIAVQGGVQAEFNAALIMRKRLTITGSTLRARSVAFKAAIASACLQRVWPLLVVGRVKPVVHSVFAAVDAEHASGSGASRAHTLMESNQHIGKIVLTWEVQV